MEITDPVLFWLGVGLGTITVVMIIVYALFAKFPELEKKAAKMTWGEDANMEVYNRTGRWM